MTKNVPNTISPDDQAPRYGLRRIERREWWLWATTVVVTLLLTGAVISFLPPLLHSGETWENLFKLQQAVWGLIGLVLLFDLYSIYQQLQIHRIRRQLLEREQLFRLIGENAADLIAVVDMDGNRIYNSVSYERALGYTIAELKSSSGFDQIHPDDRAHVQEAGAEARRTGQGKTLEYRMLHKDGSWRVLESTSSVILNAKGVPEKLVIVSRDVTDRKEATEALRQSEASFRSLVQGAPYGIYRAAIDGKFLRVNPALERMLKYTNRGELIETNLRTGVFRNVGDFDRLVELLGSEGEFKDVEVEWKRKDNKSITVRCSGRHLNESLQAASVYEVFAEDVTERRADSKSN